MTYKNELFEAPKDTIVREMAPFNRRPIRSYSLRQGRLTSAQSKALETLWPEFGLNPSQSFNTLSAFGREAPVVAEIGFGNGEALAQMASNALDRDFLGIEVHRPGVGHLLLQLKARGLTNVRIYCADAVEVLAQNIADSSLAGIHLFFPDPWPKKRHHKRRLVNPDFIELVAKKLKPCGFFHAATDWEEYAQHMLSILQHCPEMENTGEKNAYSPRPSYRPLTKFESRGQRLGHGVWDLIFIRR